MACILRAAVSMGRSMSGAWRKRRTCQGSGSMRRKAVLDFALTWYARFFTLPHCVTKISTRVVTAPSQPLVTKMGPSTSSTTKVVVLRTLYPALYIPSVALHSHQPPSCSQQEAMRGLSHCTMSPQASKLRTLQATAAGCSLWIGVILASICYQGMLQVSIIRVK